MQAKMPNTIPQLQTFSIEKRVTMPATGPPLQLSANFPAPGAILLSWPCYQSSLYTPAAACQLLSTRSCLPFAVRVSVSRSWPYATNPSFPPLQLPANFSAQAANYTTLFKLIPTTKHFRFYLPHAPSGY